MMNIYDLQQRAEILRKRHIEGSITPEEVGGLIADTLEFISLMERNASSLSITKVYNSIASMEGDKSPHVDGKPLRQGQLVCIYNAENKSDVHNGDIYMYDKDGWSFVSNIANVIVVSSPWQAYSGAKGHTLEENLTQETTARTTAITEVKDKIDSEVAALVKRLSTLQTQLNTIVSGNASEAIDNFNEVIKFLAGVKDNETLNALLEALKDSRDLNERLETLERVELLNVTEVLEFDGFTSGAVTPVIESVTDNFKILFDAINKRFVAKDNNAEHYSAGWILRKDEEHAFSAAGVYQTEGSNPRPFTKKIYVNRENNSLYRWNGEELIKVGENDVKTLNTAITELKNKKIVAEEVTTTENGGTKELTLQAGKVYALFENVSKLRIKAIAPPENAKEVSEVMLYFHTGQNGDNGVVARSGDAPMISFEGVILPKDVAIEKNMFYEVSFKYNPIARKYTALVVSWDIA